jgi:hypothetical protein
MTLSLLYLADIHICPGLWEKQLAGTYANIPLFSAGQDVSGAMYIEEE